jgi:hypothetical protein
MVNTPLVSAILVFVLVLVLGGCRKADAQPVAVSPAVFVPNTCESDDPLLHCDKSDPVVCRVDADCAAPDCGPCGSGDVITHRDLALDCGVSMCAPATFCSPEHVCKVR